MRSYYNYDEEPGASRVSFFSSWTATVKTLIIANALAYLVVLALARRFSEAEVCRWVGFYYPNLVRGFVWQPVSYMFVHGGLGHLLMNMLGLYFFGGEVERRLGRWSFLAMYFLCGVGGALLSLLQPGSVVIGASGGVLGVIVAFAVLFPDARIWVFLVIPVRARYVAIFYAFVTVASLLATTGDGIAHWAHLGGMVVAFAWVKALPALEWLGRWRKSVRRRHPDPGRERSEAEQAELDRLLEKVHRDGIGALTNPERDFLNLMSRRGRRP